MRILRRSDTKLLLLCLAVILSLGVWRWAAEDEADEPLMVSVGEELYKDDDFTVDFDFSKLLYAKIRFKEMVGSTPKNAWAVHDVYTVEDIEEFWAVIDDMKMPNVVKGLAKLVSRGTYDELVEKHNLTRGQVSLAMGDPNGILYMIYRVEERVSYAETFELEKLYKIDGRLYWRLSIRFTVPPYQVTFLKAVT